MPPWLFFVQANKKDCDRFSSFFMFSSGPKHHMQRSLSKILPLDKRFLFWDAGVVFSVSFWVDTDDASMIVVFGVGGDIDKGVCSLILEFNGGNIQSNEADGNFFLFRLLACKRLLWVFIFFVHFLWKKDCSSHVPFSQSTSQ